jgi:hypothetical protein
MVVDSELRKLAFQFMSIFSMDKGDFVRRSPGSDEFRIFSTTRTPKEMKGLLSRLYIRQELDSLLTWDYGVGLTETEAENELQKQRKNSGPSCSGRPFGEPFRDSQATSRKATPIKVGMSLICHTKILWIEFTH